MFAYVGSYTSKPRNGRGAGITVYGVDPGSGAPTQGKTPRFFALDPSGRFLYVANQNSDTIVAFRVEASTGRLAATGQTIHTGSPASIVFR